MLPTSTLRCGAVDTSSKACVSGFNADALAENGIGSNPAIDETAIVPNLVTIALNGFHDVEVVVAAHSAQHDIADRQRCRIDFTNRAKLAGFNPATH